MGDIMDLYWYNDICKENKIIEFFIKFARFEYALKKNGYYIIKKETDVIEQTDFDTYGKKYRSQNLEKTLEEFVQSLDRDPVGKLKIDGTYLKVKADAKSSIQRLLCYLRRIRNNLFHGVKYCNLIEDNTNGRNQFLIENGVKAIDFLVTLDENVQKTYQG